MITSLCLSVLLAQPSPVAIEKLALPLRLALQREALTGKAAPGERLVVAQLAAQLDEEGLAELERRGVRFERWQGRVLRSGVFYGAWTDAGGLAALAEAPAVVRLLPGAPPKTWPWILPGPLGGVHALTGAPAVWARRDALGRRLTGAGVVIADMDSGIDHFHPLFFRADGGLFAWLDLDSDQRFTPGADAVDLNRNGRLDAGEVLQVLGGRVFWYATLESLPSGEFELGRHWLFADSNGNGARDYGVAAGFSEYSPAYGEPLFVADDVDRDGQLDPGERLLRLSSSKVRAVIRAYSGEVFERGVNLILAPVHEQASHGTGAGGILVGGVYGATQVQGVAPDAELIMIDQAPAPGDPTEPQLSDVAQAALARELGAEILVHEYGTHVFTFGDGADPWEEHLDALSAAGMVQVTATHNFASPGSKALVALGAGEVQELAWEVLPAARIGWAPTTVYLTLRWRGVAGEVSAAVTGPAGQELALDGLRDSGDLWASSDTDTSTRGTAMLGAQLFRWDGVGYPPLPAGAWSLRLTNTGATAREVHVSIGDDTGYAYAVALLEQLSSVGTMAFPSTADSAISVGASAGNVPEVGEARGALKGYSGRGPRIDGPLGIDVVAPEDHYTAVPAQDAAHGDFQRFAGTSGALPQVAGAVALLRQAEPAISPAEVSVRLAAAAAVDAQTGAAPNPDWGHGKLDTQALLLGETEPNGAPVARLAAPAAARVGDEVLLDAGASQDPEEPLASLWFRWDLDYDGVWERQGRGDARPRVRFSTPGTAWIKLEVEDGWGLAAQALVRVTVSPASPAGGCGCAASGGPLAAALAVSWFWRRRRAMERRAGG